MNVLLTSGYLCLYLSGLMMGVAYMSHMMRTMLNSTDMGQKAPAMFPTTLSASYSWWCLITGTTTFVLSLLLITAGR